MTPFECYKVFNGIRLHFTVDSYSAVKYKFNSKAFTQDKFNKDHHKWSHVGLSKHFTTVEELSKYIYFITDFGKSFYLPKIYSPKLLKDYEKYNKTYFQSQDFFVEDLLNINKEQNKVISINDFFCYNDIPLLYNYLSNGVISEQTYLILLITLYDVNMIKLDSPLWNKKVNNWKRKIEFLNFWYSTSDYENFIMTIKQNLKYIENI